MKFSDFMYYHADGNDFHLFSVEHILALTVIGVLGLLLVGYHKQIRQWSDVSKRRLEIGAGVVLLLARLGLYLYYSLYQTGLKEILPIYICRITIIAVLYTLFTGRKQLRFIIYYFGIFLGVIPLIFVDTGGYTFPHVTYFSFFIGHGMILLTNIYLILVQQYRPVAEEFKQAKIAMGVYLLVVLIANPLLNGNYNYLESAPPMFDLGDFNGSLRYKVLIIALYMLLIRVEYMPFIKAKELEKQSINVD